MEKIIIEEFKRGPFLIRKEKWDGQLMGNLQAYTKSGDWVGEEAEAMQY